MALISEVYLCEQTSALETDASVVQSMEVARVHLECLGVVKDGIAELVQLGLAEGSVVQGFACGTFDLQLSAIAFYSFFPAVHFP